VHPQAELLSDGKSRSGIHRGAKERMRAGLGDTQIFTFQARSFCHTAEMILDVELVRGFINLLPV
jgi:hypothetical protein